LGERRIKAILFFPKLYSLKLDNEIKLKRQAKENGWFFSWRCGRYKHHSTNGGVMGHMDSLLEDYERYREDGPLITTSVFLDEILFGFSQAVKGGIGDDFIVDDSIFKKIGDGDYNGRTFHALITRILESRSLISRKIQVHVAKGDFSEKGGGCFSKKPSSYQIRLHIPSYLDANQVFSLLSHEIGHVFLDIRDIRFLCRNDNEVAADIATLYLGLCRYDYEGYKNLLGKDGKRHRLGYLTVNELRYCEKRILEMTT
jgi:hypothetical protein